METKGLGAGSYPEPPEPRMYEFEFEGITKGHGIVYADSIEDALRKLNNNYYEDIIDTWGLEIKNITKIRKE